MKIVFLIFGLLLGTAVSALADRTLPALFDVTGVEETDVLNVRSGPGVQNPIIGTLEYDATNIEIIKTNELGTWGQLNILGQSGWANIRFLDKQPSTSSIPNIKSCFGNEPFWALNLSGPQDSSTFNTFEILGSSRFRFAQFVTLQSPNHIDHYLIQSKPDEIVQGVIERKTCSDGMSEHTYGWEIDLIAKSVNGTTFVTGCCSLN